MAEKIQFQFEARAEQMLDALDKLDVKVKQLERSAAKKGKTFKKAQGEAKSSLKETGQVSDQLTQGMKQLGGAIAGAFNVQQIVSFYKELERARTELAKMQQQVDLSREGVLFTGGFSVLPESRRMVEGVLGSEGSAFTEQQRIQALNSLVGSAQPGTESAGREVAAALQFALGTDAALGVNAQSLNAIMGDAGVLLREFDVSGEQAAALATRAFEASGGQVFGRELARAAGSLRTLFGEGVSDQEILEQVLPVIAEGQRQGVRSTQMIQGIEKFRQILSGDISVEGGADVQARLGELREMDGIEGMNAVLAGFTAGNAADVAIANQMFTAEQLGPMRDFSPAAPYTGSVEYVERGQRQAENRLGATVDEMRRGVDADIYEKGTAARARMPVEAARRERELLASQYEAGSGFRGLETTFMEFMGLAAGAFGGPEFQAEVIEGQSRRLRAAIESGMSLMERDHSRVEGNFRDAPGRLVVEGDPDSMRAMDE